MNSPSTLGNKYIFKCPCAGYLRTVKVSNGFLQFFKENKIAGIAYCSVLAEKNALFHGLSSKEF
jgi:hypothetical protein